MRLLGFKVAQAAQVALLDNLESVWLRREFNHFLDQAPQVVALLVVVAGEVEREAVAAIGEGDSETGQLGVVHKVSDRVEKKVTVAK